MSQNIMLRLCERLPMDHFPSGFRD